MKRLILISLAVVAVVGLFVAGRVSAQSSGPEWQHWIIGEGFDGSGRSALATSLQAVESNGWEPKFILPRTLRNGALVYDVLARRGSLPATVPSAVEQPVYGTQCPGYPQPPFAGAACYADGGWR